MKARVTVQLGAVRIFPQGVPPQLFGGEVHNPPYSRELDGTWAAGSGSSPLNGQTPGTFEVEALEDGELRVFREARDATGKVVPSSESADLPMKAGHKASFNTHESNAATVSARIKPIEPELPPRRTPL